MDQSINAIEAYVGALKQSKEYQNYMRTLTAVKEVPGLLEQVNEFRRNNFIMQNSESTTFDTIEDFELKYAEFRQNPLVEDFLAAELAFCRMMQYNNSLILEALHFE
ncbi:MAG: YlbF family regulator [Lachnospiraceae bacterium]|nr:YlbF family regulator [Lachnospiraceae bacterium]